MIEQDEQVARARAGMIRDYWARRGYDVAVSIEFVPGIHTRANRLRTERLDPHWKIVTDLVNGTPRRKLGRSAA